MFSHLDRDNPLIASAKAGDIEALKIAMAIEPTPTQSEKNKALVAASECEQLEVVKFLFRYGVNVNATDDNGNAAIMWAIRKKNLALFNFFLEKKAAQCFVDNEGRTLLMLALNSGFTECIDVLFKGGPRLALFQDRDKQGKTAVAYAILNGCGYEFEVLATDWKVALDVIDHQGRTLLMLAASVGHFALVKRLVELGLNIHEKDAHGKTAFLHVNCDNSQAIMRFFLQQSPEFINLPDANGKTALSYAAERGDLSTVTFLLEQGAEHHRVDAAGWTALMYAIKKGDVPTISALFEKQDQASFDLSGLLCFSLENASLEVFFNALNLAKTINPNILNETPHIFNAALKQPDENIVGVLEACAIAINQVDEDGHSLLVKAIQCQHAPIVKWLLNRGADVNFRDPTGKTPLMYAAEGDSLDILLCLLEAGADVTAKNEAKQSVLYHSLSKAANVDALLRHHRGSRVAPEDIDVLDSCVPVTQTEVKQVFKHYKNLHVQFRAMLKDPWNKSRFDEFILQGVNVNVIYLHGAREVYSLFYVICDACHEPSGGEEKIRGLLEAGAFLREDWFCGMSSFSVGKVTRILVGYLRDKIKMAFCDDELRAHEFKAVCAEINTRSSSLEYLKYARELVRGEIEMCAKEAMDSIRALSDVKRIENKITRMKALAELDILKKKPNASKEKTAKQKLLDVIAEAEVQIICLQRDKFNALLTNIKLLVGEKQEALKAEPMFFDVLLNALDQEEQGGLRCFLVKMLNEQERQRLKKHLYDAIKSWSEQYKPGVDEEPEQPRMIDNIKRCFDQYQPGLPLCALFEILRLSDSGRVNVNTGTWGDFVKLMQHGNYLKPYAAKFPLFLWAGRSAGTEGQELQPIRRPS